MISKKLLAKMALIVIVGATLAIPFAALAAQNADGTPAATYQAPSLWPTGFWGPLVSCTGNYPVGSQNNQLTVNGNAVPYCNNLCDLIGTIINVIYFVMSIAIFIITPVAFVIGAIMLLVSGANPEMLGTAKKILKTTVIGLALVLCSYLIVKTFTTVLGINGVGGFGTALCQTNS